MLHLISLADVLSIQIVSLTQALSGKDVVEIGHAAHADGSRSLGIERLAACSAQTKPARALRRMVERCNHKQDLEAYHIEVSIRKHGVERGLQKLPLYLPHELINRLWRATPQLVWIDSSALAAPMASTRIGAE